jgi:hypothetical protein
LSAEFVGGVSGVRRDGPPDFRVAVDGTAEGRLMFGHGFDWLGRHAFVGIEAGWHWRPGPPADEAAIDTIVGIAPWSSALLMLQSFSIIGTGRAEAPYRRYDLAKLQLSLAQRITARLWLQIGAIGTVAGAGTGAPGGVFALWWRY